MYRFNVSRFTVSMFPFGVHYITQKCLLIFLYIVILLGQLFYVLFFFSFCIELMGLQKIVPIISMTANRCHYFYVIKIIETA